MLRNDNYQERSPMGRGGGGGKEEILGIQARVFQAVGCKVVVINR